MLALPYSARVPMVLSSLVFLATAFLVSTSQVIAAYFGALIPTTDATFALVTNSTVLGSQHNTAAECSKPHLGYTFDQTLGKEL